MNRKSLLTIAVLTGAAFTSVSCTERQRERTENQAERAADRAGNEMSDAATTTAVKSKLAADVRLSTLTSINVDTNGHVVTLSGSVPTAADKEMAEAAAKSIDGVTSVVNNLEVRP